MNVLRCLPLFNVDKQKKLRGAANSSNTNVVTTGFVDAFVKLLSLVLETFVARKAQNVDADLDQLDPEQLVKATYDRFVAHPDFEPPTTDIAQMRERMEALRTLRSGRPTRLLRDAEDLAQEVVREKSQQFRDAFHRAVGQVPQHTASLAEQCRAVLDAMELPVEQTVAYHEYVRIVRTLSELPAKRHSFPKTSFDVIHQILSEAGLARYDHALRGLAAEKIADALRSERAALYLYFDERLKYAADFEANSAAIRQTAEERRTAAYHRNAVSRTSVQLDLPGPTEQDVTTGLMTTLGCKDQQQLTSKLLDLAGKSFTALASEHYPWLPAGSELGVLLTHIRPDHIVDAFENLLAESAGEGQSFYEVVERSGIEQVASELYHRSEDLCHLRARDRSEFNVTPTASTIVRLPRPTGRRDADIRQRLMVAFKSFDRLCHFEDASPQERNACVVVRSRFGFPIGVEAGNLPMLFAYADSARTGHLPHLIGFYPGSADGTPSRAYVELAQALSHQRL